MDRERNAMSEEQPKIAKCTMTPRSIAALLEIEFVTVEQGAAENFYSPRTIRQWCDEGRIEAYKWSGRWLIVRSELATFCRSRRD